MCFQPVMMSLQCSLIRSLSWIWAIAKSLKCGVEKQKSLYSLAALADIAWRTWTCVSSHRFHTGSSIHTAELQTVIHLVLTVFPCVSRLTVTLVVCQKVFTCAVDTGTWRTLIYLHLTQFPLPSGAAAAVKLIKLVLTYTLVEAGLGIANWCTLASSDRLVPT